MIEKMCKNCGSSYVQWNSLQKHCQKCAYNLYAKPKKQITRWGKKSKEWMEKRHEWIKAHPPINGYWECYLKISPMCLGQVDIDQLTVDHVIPKSNAQNYSNRNDDSNLKPACVFCNNMKGSKSLEVFND